MIRYSVRLADLNRHQFEVDCRLDTPGSEEIFSLPSWIPGSYLLREFARHVVKVRASSAGQEIPIEKIDNASWRCRDATEDLTVTITVYALDRSVRGAYLDGRRAFFNGPCLFPRVQGHETERVEVTLEVPDDHRAAEWRVATSMAPVDTDEQGFGRYEAADYDELIDHPVEISDFVTASFEAGGVPHHLVLTGRHDTDLDRIVTDLTQLCETQIRFFGNEPPFSEYRFLTLVVSNGYGGLEHRASSSLITRRTDLPRIGEPGVPASYQRFLGLCSHEYFHSWNIKRIKPAAFSPYRLDRRNLTRLLWVFEGITSYYQDLFLLRSDLIGAKDYLTRLGIILTRFYRAPGRRYQNLEESSFDAWDKLYKPEPNSINSTISYYSKGALVALMLDLTLRAESSSKASLDDVMSELWARYGDSDSGVAEGAFEKLVEEVSGIPLGEFFDAAVRGTDELPLREKLAEFGVVFSLRQSTERDDQGGTKPTGRPETRLGLGVEFRDREVGILLTQVLEGGPAEGAGLVPGDHLLALDGKKITGTNVKNLLARFEVGTTISANVFRDDELLEVELVLQPEPVTTVALELDKQADADVIARREQWLGT
ncbi:MAG: M61 family metallopeptidase [Gammaproteobacteria bacterium]